MDQTTTPEAGKMPPTPTPPPPAYRRKEGLTGPILLIAIGLLLLADNLLPGFDFSDYWPLILVAIGVGLLLKSRQSL